MNDKRPFDLTAHERLREPLLRFGSTADNDVDEHPLRGLLRYGPYSRNWIAGVPDQIRIAMIGQQGMIGRMRGLVRELESNLRPRDASAYRPDYQGMSKTFGVRPVGAGSASEIILPDTLTDDVLRARKPYVVLAEALQRAITQLKATRNDFDVVFIGIDAAWEPAFVERDEEDFDLHDYLKAVGASMGISVQLIRSDKALDYHCRASVMWRLSIALYTKAGAFPGCWRTSTRRPPLSGSITPCVERRTTDPASLFAVRKCSTRKAQDWNSSPTKRTASASTGIILFSITRRC